MLENHAYFDSSADGFD